jgi:hypothetical protein
LEINQGFRQFGHFFNGKISENSPQWIGVFSPSPFEPCVGDSLSSVNDHVILVVGPATWEKIMSAPIPVERLDKSQVLALQVKLKNLGLYGGALDGTFSDPLRIAVTLFQQQNGLVADGVVGPLTFEKIMAAPNKPRGEAPPRP